MKYPSSLLFALPVVAGLVLSSSADTLVNDTWADGDRTSSSPGGDSAWYQGGAGTLDVVGPGGPMRGDLGVDGGSSASWTTYFAPAGSPVTLSTPGDMLRLTWEFSVTNLGDANTSQNFRLALVNSPADARLTEDASPGSAAYSGYSMFMNMGADTLGNSNPFQLRERAAPETSSALLSSSGSWSSLANGATTGTQGYEEGVQYTYVMQLTLNNLGGLDIETSMTGGNLNDTGTASISFTDETPNGLSFDTFHIRPSSAVGTAQIFDTSLLQVEATIIPEPSVVGMLGMGLLGLVLAHRRARR